MPIMNILFSLTLSLLCVKRDRNGEPLGKKEARKTTAEL